MVNLLFAQYFRQYISKIQAFFGIVNPPPASGSFLFALGSPGVAGKTPEAPSPPRLSFR
jgi:hypothetical protein